MDLKENYEKLANTIIIQAVKDYRAARRYLKKHPHTKELDETVAEQDRRWREQEEKQRKRQGGRKAKEPPERKPTREGKQLSRIIDAEKVLSEVERFFHSEWFGQLTSLDGEMLLRKIREE